MAVKKMMAMSLMVWMMMVLLAVQVRATDELDIGVSDGMGSCAAKCALKCVFKFSPPRIALCTALCLIGCKISPSPAIFDCTTGCANSVVNAYNPTDATKVNNIVGSCYKTCKHNN